MSHLLVYQYVLTFNAIIVGYYMKMLLDFYFETYIFLKPFITVLMKGLALKRSRGLFGRPHLMIWVTLSKPLTGFCRDGEPLLRVIIVLNASIFVAFCGRKDIINMTC